MIKNPAVADRSTAKIKRRSPLRIPIFLGPRPLERGASTLGKRQRFRQRQLDLVDYPNFGVPLGTPWQSLTFSFVIVHGIAGYPQFLAKITWKIWKPSDIKWPWSRICEHGAKKQPFGAMSPSRGYSKFAEKWWSSKRWLATLVPDRPLFWVTRWYAFPMVFL